MNRDEIIRMAREANGEEAWDGGVEWVWAEVERFAAIIAAAEREACAKVCEDLLADEFITRTEATVWDVATLDCATAIRARREQ